MKKIGDLKETNCVRAFISCDFDKFSFWSFSLEMRLFGTNLYFTYILVL